MTASALVPQFTVECEPSLTALAQRRRELERTGVGVSFTDLFVAACSRALRTCPGVNSSFADDAIVDHPDINIGLAVALADGLIVPAIRQADRLTLPQLAAERERLSLAAREGNLTPEDIFSATFTISNLGPYGVKRFRALVVPPQAAILAIGAITSEQSVCVALSCDHRVLDGALAAKFLNDLVGLLESPDWVATALAPAAFDRGPHSNSDSSERPSSA